MNATEAVIQRLFAAVRSHWRGEVALNSPLYMADLETVEKGEQIIDLDSTETCPVCDRVRDDD